MSAPVGFPPALWAIKVRLQFTGWLQFMAMPLGAAMFLMLAGLGRLVGVYPALIVWPPLALGSLLFLGFVLEVLVMKWGLHPAEPLPARRDAMDTFEVMRARRAYRSFQARNLSDSHLAELMEQVRLHTRPEALLGERPIRLEYIRAPLTVWPVIGGHEFLVAVAPSAYDRLAVIDVGRCLEKVVHHATKMGLGTCWIGPGADQRSIVAHMGERFDPEADHIVCVCAIGYASRYVPVMIRGMNRLQHHRLPLSALFFADPGCTRPLDLTAPAFARFGRCYEVCQWSPSSFNEQPTRCVAVMEGDRLRFDFLMATNSRYYAPVALGIWCANWELGCEALGISGHFEVMETARRGEGYGVSWVED